MNAAGQEGPDREHDGPGLKAQSGLGDHAGDAVAGDDQVVHALLEQEQVWLGVEQPAHGLAIERPVGLGPGGAHGRSLAGIESAEVDAGLVGSPGHEPAQRVDLPGEMALADAADGGVAAHLADGFQILGQQQRAGAQARGGRGSFGARMATAHHDHIKGIAARHRWAF